MNTTCAVVGGGPAGMVLGLLLARAGVDVTVLEKHGDFLRDFRGDTVHPTTLRLLTDLGLGPRFERLAYSKVDRIEFPAPDGRPVVAADLHRLPIRFPYVAMVPQWDLLDLLAEAGRAEPAFHLLMNTEAVDTIAEHGRVTGVHYRTADGRTGELRADLTIAADGRWSTIRRSVGLVPHEYPVPMDTWWFRLPRHASDSGAGLTGVVHDRDLAVIINRTSYYQIALLSAKGTDGELRAAGLDAFRARIAALIPRWADRVDAIADLDDVKHLDVRLNRLRTWYAEGVLCIGDAAHAMSPAGGVGINLAIQDAVAAATLLAAPLRDHTVTTKNLAAVQRRRWLPTVVVQRVQRMLHDAVFAPVVTGARSALPPPLITALRRIPVLRYIPAYVIGVGIRPERAPRFARRQPIPAPEPVTE
jgi:2-polyprenyl-6-methoxyphenol hydroxylase-like FAD-dependent oxidoreductase